MPVKASFEIKGLDAYLEDLARAGEDVDQVVTDVLTEAAPFAKAELEANLRKTSETWTGETAESIASSSVQRDGNYHFIELTAGGKDAPGAIYKEFGSTRQAAEPFFRPAFRKLRQHKLKAMMKEVMQRFGLQ
jgi:HK97 gp10 family phage protein